MVGNLSSSVTLWDVFNTMSAAAGVIVANDLLQSPQDNINSVLSYNLGYLQEQGMIGTDGSSALDWDWEGLEDALENDTSDRGKVVKGVFGESGGAGQGGDDNDPWYKKFVNWVKSAVNEGSIKTTGVLGNVQLAIDAISLMIGAYLGKYVESGVPVNFDPNYASILSSGGCGLSYRMKLYPNIVVVKIATDCAGAYSVPPGTNTKDPIPLQLYNLKDESVNYYVYTYQNGEIVRTSNYTTPANGHNYNIGLSGLTGNNYYYDLVYLGNVFNVNDLNYVLENGLPEKSSNDIITETGKATGQDWVPTPYYDGDGTAEFEIIPQEVITEFTEEVPDLDNTEIPEAFTETVNPYISIPSQNPTPGPTTSPGQDPLPTYPAIINPDPGTVPSISEFPINGEDPEPTAVPAYDPDAELGTPENPITTTDPDPVPGVNSGEGFLNGLEDVFPFCIPWDIAYLAKMFNKGEPKAPVIEVDFKNDHLGFNEHIVFDFSMFDTVAYVLRKLEMILFGLALAVGTKNLIWS